MEPLTVRELVVRAEQVSDDERTPFAEVPWTAASQVVWREGGETAPIHRDGMIFDYFLEPSIIAELKEGLDTSDEHWLVERVIRYARDDA